MKLVRVWCLPIELLDDKHLVAEHFETHVLYSVITKGLKGFRNHPQTMRFKNHVGMLIDRHRQQVAEMGRRGFHHHSSLVGEVEVYRYSRADFLFDLLVLMNRNGD